MSLSTLKGAYELSDEFKKYQADFFKAMQQRAAKAGFQAWVIGDGNDPAKALELMDLFKRHQVEFQTLNAEITADGQVFKPGHAWVIPVKQRQFGLAQAMLETRTKFEDNTFYDVSAWSLPMAYNLPVAKLARIPATSNDSPALASSTPDPDAVAWVISWQQLNAPACCRTYWKPAPSFALPPSHSASATVPAHPVQRRQPGHTSRACRTRKNRRSFGHSQAGRCQGSFIH